MRRRSKSFFFFLSEMACGVVLFLICSGCEESLDLHAEGEFKRVIPSSSDKDVELPKSLLTEIKDLYTKVSKSSSENSTDSSANQLLESHFQIPRKSLSLKVQFLPEKNGSMALDGPIEIHFPKTGGKVDLSEVVKGSRGSFRVRFLVDWEDLAFSRRELQAFELYYVSQSKVRAIGKEKWGAGCSQVYRLTSSFDQVLSKKGLLLNAKEQRYLSMLGGILVFVAIRGNELYLASIDFTDKRHPEWLCKRRTGNENQGVRND